MSRHERRRWRVGDQVLTPWYRNLRTPAGYRGLIGGWRDSTVVAVRGDRVVTRQWSWEEEHAAFMVRPARTGHIHRPAVWRHDDSKGRIRR